ncbi:butanol dehydrogenase [Paenibacillus sp. FSL R7-0273]|uniref:iron-containing alcohol dehydrogenase n=1 Tax=Paenibacillus sp. FSL R7-0273 TaxID=1536772 RepID=UPI0004F5AFA0|nr:iron-containing alcohol dehydrogenase [Paenibacillus sp. FSL R7-0273]AIQ45777.1 butanol dehydrogenase [Paenibacillus sp. FSL R7-0273]OMF95302.1 butanol dehydrogenase [Paenibacillus sp. FSL R7-0273]
MNRFTIPRDIYFGENALDILKTLRGQKATLVIGGGSIKNQGYLDKIKQLLEAAGMETQLIEGINTEPTVAMVQAGAAQMREFQPDWIIGLGGGSPMDAAKAMWIFYEYPELTFEQAAVPFTLPELRTKAKFIGIPTTSGTAAEISNLSVITDEQTGIKYPLADFGLTPDIAIIDPILVAQMPQHMIAYSGMDAVTHSLEAYVAKPRTIFTDALAIEAAEALKDHLLASYQGDMSSREKVHYAQAMAGMSFANAVLGNVHSLAHKSGPTFNIPHGLANAIYLPYVIQFNRKAIEERYAKLAARLKLKGDTTKELTDSLIEWVRELNREMGIPGTIKELGITETEFLIHVDVMAANAVKDPCTGTNPRETSVGQMKQLYEAAFYGRNVTF